MRTGMDGERAWRWRRQGLDGSLEGASPADVLARTGWSRSVGGVGPYLAIFARSGASRAAIDDALASVAIHELPAVRGCTYVVPSADYAVALRAGHGDDAEMKMARKHLGVTDDEVAALEDAVVAALRKGPLEPAALKTALGGAVRDLGEAGRKRGMATTLPLALGRLQGQGRIRRIPTNGRLDQQRYAYAAWDPSPLDGVRLSDETVGVALAERYFTWAGPRTADAFAWWSGLGKKAAKAAITAAGLVADGERFGRPEDVESLRTSTVPNGERVALVGSLDNLFHLGRDVGSLVDDVDAAFPERRKAAGSALSDLDHHAIVDRGTLVGLWDYDVAERKIVWATFEKPTAAIRDAVARTERFVRDELGDARTFSLDSPESRGDRLAALRKRA